MNEKLDLILTKLQDIEKDIGKLKEDMELVKKQTRKMDEHVDFVNGVYTHVEQPLNYVVEKWNHFFKDEKNIEHDSQKLLE